MEHFSYQGVNGWYSAHILLPLAHMLYHACYLLRECLASHCIHSILTLKAKWLNLIFSANKAALHH